MKRFSWFILGMIAFRMEWAHSDLIHFYHPDPLGSIGIVTDRDGGIAEQTFYSPYGELLHDERLETRNPSEFQYTGQEKDSASDLYDDGARYYDPALSQFLSVDPVEGNLPYAYVNNNPLIFIDPDGKDPGLYSPEVYPKVLDYRADHAGEDPSSDLVERWQTESYLRNWAISILCMGGIQRGGPDERRRNVSQAEYERLLEESGGNIAKVARELGQPYQTAYRRVVRSFKLLPGGEGRKGVHTPEEILTTVVEAKGNLSEAARRLGFDGASAVIYRLNKMGRYEAVRKMFPAAKVIEQSRSSRADPEKVLAAVRIANGDVSVAAGELHVSDVTVRSWIRKAYPGGYDQFRTDYPRSR